MRSSDSNGLLSSFFIISSHDPSISLFTKTFQEIFDRSVRKISDSGAVQILQIHLIRYNYIVLCPFMSIELFIKSQSKKAVRNPIRSRAAFLCENLFLFLCIGLRSLRRIFVILQNVARLAVQHIADRLERRETDGADLARFNLGQIHIGNAHFFRQFVQAHFPVSHDPVEP